MKNRLVLVVAALATITSLSAQSTVSEWWNGNHATGDWLGVRTTLDEKGITISGGWKANFFGVVDGGKQQHGAFDEQILLSLKIDFEKLAGIPGLTAQASAWYRDGRSVNNYVGASPAFNPSALQVGTGWRLLPVYLQWESRDLLPIKDMLTLAGGWANPYYFFIQQPASQLFVNNALFQTKGLVNSGIPWSGAADTWGGHLKVKPTTWSYAQTGLYMAIPGALSSGNHGLYFQGASPAGSNGLYVIGETGITPQIGPAKLPGKYAFGGIYFGVENTGFNGTPQEGRYALYWQADQMLFREASAPTASPETPGGATTVADPKTFREPLVTAPLSEQGLHAFSFLSFAPKYNNAMPFYFHTGLVYKGLIPSRNKDQLGVAFALGSYSDDKLQNDQATARPQQTTEAVLELDYRVQINKFSYIQPFLQYLIRPNGTGQIKNATILGLQMGVTF